jgi:hypothetical protein
MGLRANLDGLERHLDSAARKGDRADCLAAFVARDWMHTEHPCRLARRSEAPHRSGAIQVLERLHRVMPWFDEGQEKPGENRRRIVLP